MSTLCTAEKQGGGLVGGAGLHLEVVGLGMSAFGTLRFGGGGAIPGLFASEYVVHSLFRKVGNFTLNTRNDAVDVGTGATLEAEMFATFVNTGLVCD